MHTQPQSDGCVGTFNTYDVHLCAMNRESIDIDLILYNKVFVHVCLMLRASI